MRCPVATGIVERHYQEGFDMKIKTTRRGQRWTSRLLVFPVYAVHVQYEGFLEPVERNVER